MICLQLLLSTHTFSGETSPLICRLSLISTSSIIMIAVWLMIPLSPAFACHHTVPGQPGCPDMIVDKDDHIHVAYHNDGPREIYFKSSFDKGQTWTDPINLSNNSYRSTRPRLAVDTLGRIAIIWKDGKYINFSYSSNDGFTWASPKTIMYEGAAPNIILYKKDDNNDNIYLVWQTKIGKNNIDVFFVVSNDFGKTWNKPINISDNIGESRLPVIAVDNNGEIFIVWYDFTKAYPSRISEIFFTKSVDEGLTWTAPKAVCGITGQFLRPVIGVDDTGNLIVAWSGSSSDNVIDIYVCTSSDTGETWTSPVNISKTSGRSRRPYMAINGNFIYMSWEDETPGGYAKAADIFFNKSYDGGYIWKIAKDVWKDTNTHSEINVIKFDTAGDMYIVWEKKFNEIQNVYFTKSYDEGESWTFIRNLTGIDRNFSGKKPVFSPGTELGYFIWQDNDTKQWHIRWNPDGTVHNFEGTISTDGQFTNVEAIDFGKSDSMNYNEKKINFTAKANRSFDGLDIIAKPYISRLFFDIKIDKKYNREKTFIGETLINPEAGKFMIRREVKAAEIDHTGMPDFVPGNEPGYFIWQNKETRRWQVRWNGDSVSNRNFKGELLTASQITAAKEFYMEQDFLEVGSNTISFYGIAKKHFDAFSFQTSTLGGFVYFDILEDDMYQPDNTFIGSQKLIPSTIPFIIEEKVSIENIDTSGMPTFTSGNDIGYYVWHDNSTRDLHIRWNGDGENHYFNGTITTDGLIINVNKKNYEPTDFLIYDDTKVYFEGYAGKGLDGIDITIQPDVSWVIFDIQQDNKYLPEYVFAGRDNTNPSVIPFKIDP